MNLMMEIVHVIGKSKRHEIESIYAFHLKWTNYYWNDRAWRSFGMSFGLAENYIPLAMATTVAFGISITGLMLGFAEKRRSLTLNTWIGIIGNLIVVGFFVFIVIYSFAT